MSRARRLGRLGGLAAVAVAAMPFAWLWVVFMAIAAWLLWRAWWRRAGDRLAAAGATLPADRRDWGAAMAAELAQVEDRGARWRFAAGCAGRPSCRRGATGRRWAWPGSAPAPRPPPGTWPSTGLRPAPRAGPR